MSTDNVVPFPVRMPVELELVAAIKDAVYEFTGRVSVAQVIGCMDIAMREIRENEA